jgi:hypothetical protein
MIPPQPRRVAAWLAVAASWASAQDFSVRKCATSQPKRTDRPKQNRTAQLTKPPLSSNLTLRFLPSTPDSSSDPTCAYSNTTSALTFTTASVPVQSICFNLAELFDGNATSGFVNQTLRSQWYESGFRWSLENAETFDAQANYSQVLYHQAAREQEPMTYAPRRVNLYGGLDCTERDPGDDKGLLDWYGLSCGTGPSAGSAAGEGICDELPYRVASFAVLPQSEDADGTCLIYAQLGAGVGRFQPLTVVVLVGAVVAGWLML